MISEQSFTHNGQTFTLEPLTDASGPLRLVWLHGWRDSKESLRPLANQLLPLGESWLIDSSGHGTAPTAPEGTNLSPAATAEALGAWLATLPPCPTIIIGHSMGFRFALHAAARGTPNLVGIASLAGAGIPRPQSLRKKLRRKAVGLFMALGHRVKPLVGEGLLNAFRRRFASTDYLGCPAALRPLFMQVVRDDVTPFLPSISTPTLLLYGAEDDITPPSMGQTFAKKMPRATLHILPRLNHTTILTHGRHVVGNTLTNWIKNLI